MPNDTPPLETLGARRLTMPWHPQAYPEAWRAVIRPAILARAAQHCEGSPAYPGCRARNHTPHPATGSPVVLTIAHLCRCAPPCGESAHLRALCQRCHLTLDAELHAQHATARRYRERE